MCNLLGTFNLTKSPTSNSIKHQPPRPTNQETQSLIISKLKLILSTTPTTSLQQKSIHATIFTTLTTYILQHESFTIRPWLAVHRFAWPRRAGQGQGTVIYIGGIAEIQGSRTASCWRKDVCSVSTYRVYFIHQPSLVQGVKDTDGGVDPEISYATTPTWPGARVCAEFVSTYARRDTRRFVWPL